MAPERSETIALPPQLSDVDAPERIECVCSRRPLLARAGRFSGRAFIWVKHTKAQVDIVITSGTVRIRCRECFRFHTITVGDRVKSEID